MQGLSACFLWGSNKPALLIPDPMAVIAHIWSGYKMSFSISGEAALNMMTSAGCGDQSNIMDTADRSKDQVSNTDLFEPTRQNEHSALAVQW